MQLLAVPERNFVFDSWPADLGRQRAKDTKGHKDHTTGLASF